VKIVVPSQCGEVGDLGRPRGGVAIENGGKFSKGGCRARLRLQTPSQRLALGMAVDALSTIRPDDKSALCNLPTSDDTHLPKELQVQTREPIYLEASDPSSAI
jgi:hypothetical protein